MGGLNGVPAGDIIGAKVVGMITNITLGNFKCFRHVSINPKLVTVLIGPNGTGKSGVLQALMLLKQSRDDLRSLQLQGDLVWFPPEAFKRQSLDPVSQDVELSLSGCWHIESEAVESQVDFSIDLSYWGDARLKGKRGRTVFRIEGREWEMQFRVGGAVPHIETPVGGIIYEGGNGINDFMIRHSSGTVEGSNADWSQISSAPSDTLANLKVVPAARALARGIYRLGSEPSEDISSTDGLGKQEEETATTLAYSRGYVEKVSRLMKGVTEVGFRTDTVPPQSAKPISEAKSGDFSLVAEGFGTNALVRLLFEVVRAVPGATVLIEEPEVHLHPKAQADLTSVLVEEAKADNKQIIMTTHSEHVAGRLLTLVAEGTLLPDEVAIYSFEKDENGVCSAGEIEVTEHGQVVGGLKSFFETDVDEMRRFVDALRSKA